MVAMRRSRYVGDQPRAALPACAACGSEATWHSGRLVVTLCPDGRRLIRLETGRKDAAWLELGPDDARWLAERLTMIPEPGSGS